MSRKDSKGMFAAVLGQLSEDKEREVAAVRSSSPHLLKVAAGVRQMHERSEAAERLLRAGEQIVELDANAIQPSSIHDRYDEAYEAEAVSEIAASMRERGQIVPGLVRPVVGQEGVYQIVYGRRRLAAAKQLGMKFKTAIRDLTDEEAVIFQGEENTAREDLSFIEKCAFALAQQEVGFKRDTICASLSTGKSHVSEMIAIASEIPSDLLHSMGKAPGIGRPRWAKLVEKLQSADQASWKRLIASPDFKRLTSLDRFEAVFKLLSTKSAGRHSAQPRRWAPADKEIAISIKSTAKKTVVTFEASNGQDFAGFITDQLDDLYEAFQRSSKAIGD